MHIGPGWPLTLRAMCGHNDVFAVTFIFTSLSVVQIYDFHIFTVIYSSLHRFIWNQHNDQLPVGLLAHLVGHQYRRGHRFKSCTGLNFFSVLIFTTAQVLFITAKITFIFTSIIFVDLISFSMQLINFHTFLFSVSLRMIPLDTTVTDASIILPCH